MVEEGIFEPNPEQWLWATSILVWLRVLRGLQAIPMRNSAVEKRCSQKAAQVPYLLTQVLRQVCQLETVLGPTVRVIVENICAR